jgi:tetratricopeptide (TPR) repeat protein
VGGWQVFNYIAAASERAEAAVQAGIKNLAPNRYQQAVEQFNKALEIDPNSWNAYYRRGIANQYLGNLDAALADYQAAMQLNPNLVEAMTARAGIFADKGEVQRSIDELTKVIDQKPTVEAHYRRGTGYATLKEYDKAIEDFTWVIEEVRDAPYVYFARANSRRAIGDFAGAAADDRLAQSFDRGRQPMVLTPPSEQQPIAVQQ